LTHVLRHGSSDLFLLRWPQRDAGAAIEFPSSDDAWAFAATLVADPHNAAAIRLALAEADPGIDLCSLSDSQVADEFAFRLVHGNVRVAGYQLVDVPQNAAPTAKAASSEPPPAAAPKKPKAKTWIKIKVIDDRTHEPISGVRLKVTLPDGTEQFETTAGSGIVQIQDIDQGTCDVECDLKGALLTDTFNFVAMGEPPATPKPADSASVCSLKASLTRIARIEAHKVKTGESIDSLAKKAGMKWQDLARFNWGTDVPKEINVHLVDEVGCTKKTKDGKNYVFTDDDSPGIVYIPTKWSETGLATEKTHVVRVKPVVRFLLLLENDDGLRVPEADYEATLAEGTKKKGKLGKSGIAAIDDPPPGPVAVVYPDHDDVLAKNLASSARLAFDDRDVQELFRVLKRAGTTVKAMIKAYEKYYNTLGGKGFVQDLYDEVTDEDALIGLDGVLARAGIETRNGAGVVECGLQEDGA
jgi:hypothetical protein